MRTSSWLDAQDAVREFMLAGDKACDVPAPSTELRELCCSLIAEEVAETEAAYRLENFVEIVDGLADAMYVVFFAVNTFGRVLETAAFDEIEGAIGRQAGWVEQDFIRLGMQASPDLVHYVTPGTVPVYRGRTKSLEQALVVAKASTLHALHTEHVDPTPWLTGLAYELQLLAIYHCVDLGAVFDVVHAANMSKVVDGKVRYLSNGKIAKPPGFKKPDIVAELRRQGWVE